MIEIELERRMAGLVPEEDEPPLTITAAGAYRAGLRRRRWGHGLGVLAAAAGVVGVLVGGYAVIDARTPGYGPMIDSGPAAGPSAARTPALAPEHAPDLTPEPGPARRPSAGPSPAAGDGPPESVCDRQLRLGVTAAVRTALPAQIKWGEDPDANDAEGDCRSVATWVPFEYQGVRYGLRIDAAGREDIAVDGCDSGFSPVRCVPVEGGRVGYFDGATDYGVLLGRPGVMVILTLTQQADGLPRPAGQPGLSHDQLADAALAAAEALPD